MLCNNTVFPVRPSRVNRPAFYRAGATPRVDPYLLRARFYRVLKGFYYNVRQGIGRYTPTAPKTQKGLELATKRAFNSYVARIMGGAYLRDFYRWKYHLPSNLDTTYWLNGGVEIDRQLTMIEGATLFPGINFKQG